MIFSNIYNPIFSVTQEQQYGCSSRLFPWDACLTWVPLPLTF